MTNIPTIQVEAKLTRHSKRADGGLNIGLAVHPHGIPGQLRNAELGDRFMVVLVQLDDNEQPVSQQKEPAQAPAPVSSQTPQARAQAKLHQHIAMTCNDPQFQRWLNEESPIGFGPCMDAEDAARIVRKYLEVKSRADVMPNSPEHKRWDWLESAFVCWRDKDRVLEAS